MNTTNGHAPNVGFGHVGNYNISMGIEYVGLGICSFNGFKAKLCNLEVRSDMFLSLNSMYSAFDFGTLGLKGFALPARYGRRQ